MPPPRRARRERPVRDDYFPDAIDVHAGPLLSVYLRATKRLRAMIQGSIVSGKLGQAAYRQERLDEVDGIMDRLKRDTTRTAPAVIERAYSAGVLAVNETAGIRVAFGVVHQDAVRVLTKAMTERLDTAVEVTRASARSLYVQDTVTALANARAGRTPVGRRIDDVARKTALEVLAEREITGDTVREAGVTIKRDLERQGMTAIVDRRGRRIPLDTYAPMVARTTTREAVTLGTANRLVEGGSDLVTVSAHRHQDGDPICIPYAGKTFSLTGRTMGYPILDQLPPFHPNCRHVITPAAATFEALEAALGLAPA